MAQPYNVHIYIHVYILLDSFIRSYRCWKPIHCNVCWIVERVVCVFCSNLFWRDAWRISLVHWIVVAFAAGAVVYTNVVCTTLTLWFKRFIRSLQKVVHQQKKSVPNWIMIVSYIHLYADSHCTPVIVIGVRCICIIF